jgi:hypothetical protein
MTIPEGRGAWHGNPDVKAAAVLNMKAHAAMDEIIQGMYLRIEPDAVSGFRGCFLACMVAEMIAAERRISLVTLRHDPMLVWPDEVERFWAIPSKFAEVIEDIFEGLPNRKAAAQFAVSIVEAIPVGADLTYSDSWTDLVDSDSWADLLDDHPGQLDFEGIAKELLNQLAGLTVPRPE